MNVVPFTDRGLIGRNMFHDKQQTGEKYSKVEQ